MKWSTKLSLLGALMYSGASLAGSPACSGANETKLSWPAENPVWEMCWLRPGHSAGPQGSGMELRDVHYRGISVLKTAHSPLLFAEYASSTCYRDWKNSDNRFVAEAGVRNQLGTSVDFKATTSCDRSLLPNTSYGQCPYQLPGMTAADCFEGLSIEDEGTHVVLTTHYDASWYAYTSRAIFYADGSFDLRFGFGNFSNTSNTTTHWHHNYWRLDFDIDGPEDNVLSINDVIQSTEFTSLRDNEGGPDGVERTWEVRNSKTGRGYRVLPASDDYVTPTNESGRGFHMTDVIGTVYVPNEYGDLIGSNPLGACAMNHNNLANGQNLLGGEGTGTDVVLYYRAAVKDTAGVDAMVCKSAGPMFQPLGNWSGEPDPTADLSIVFDPATVPPTTVGGTVSLTIDVENAGPDDATDVAVEITLPAELVFQSGRATAANKLQDYVRGSDWTCADDQGTVTCDLGTALAAGTPAPSLVIEAAVDAEATPGTVSVSAVVAALEADPSAANNEASIDVEIEEKPGPDEHIFCDGFEDGGDGSCGGGPVEPDDIVVFDDINFTTPNTTAGGSVRFDTGETCTCDTALFDFNIWGATTAGFYWPGSSTGEGGVTVDGTNYAVLASGATIGPKSNFINGLSSTLTTHWRQAGNVDGYLGFRFVNPETSAVNYGYVRITMTGTTGHPATIVSWAYNSAGDPITIP